MREDIGERNNLYSQYPDLIVEMEGKAQKLRQDVGDTAKGINGKNRRLKGIVDSPKPLTVYRQDCPYMVAEYDLADMPVMTG